MIPSIYYFECNENKIHYLTSESSNGGWYCSVKKSGHFFPIYQISYSIYFGDGIWKQSDINLKLYSKNGLLTFTFENDIKINCVSFYRCGHGKRNRYFYDGSKKINDSDPFVRIDSKDLDLLFENHKIILTNKFNSNNQV